MTIPKLKGKYPFHNKAISWSYRIRGNEALTQIKKKIIKTTLKPNQPAPPLKSGIGESHPPPKKIVVKQLIKIIWAYSARKNKAKDIEAYSTLYPETSSDSPSVKSKGARLVSAKIEAKNIIVTGNSGKKNQIPLFCAKTISVTLKEPTHNKTEIRISPIETS